MRAVIVQHHADHGLGPIVLVQALKQADELAASMPGLDVGKEKDSPWAMRVLKHNDQRQEILGSTFAKDYLLAWELVENVRRL